MPSAEWEINSVGLTLWWGKAITLRKWSVKFSLLVSIWAQTEGAKDLVTENLRVQGIQSPTVKLEEVIHGFPKAFI